MIRENDLQAVTDILLANHRHLELLYLDVSFDGLWMERFLLPPNLSPQFLASKSLLPIHLNIRIIHGLADFESILGCQCQP